ncbi:MAG: prepilin-type N-terminal cleavage/methylation domain-containing protein [Variovorax sp.]|nr:MAG: prepilin-type N-terminal cleavage/methylation domain-containing protein [Variovorax sp.]
MPLTFLPPPSLRHPGSGFTAVELMVVVAITAILAAMAMPSYRNLIDRYRVRQATEDLTAMLYLARAEAIKRGGRITVHKASSEDCSTAGAGDWSCGWIVFVDSDQDGAFDAGDEQLQISPAPRGVNVKFVLGTGRSFMQGDAWGRFGGMGGFSFELKPKRNPNIDFQVHLCMSSGGRLRMLKGSALCS